MTTERDYVAYMLRLWWTSGKGKRTWRACLESTATGERRGFASLDDLVDFLRQQTDAAPDSDESATAPC